jgi:hypothetical protein
MGSWFFHNSKFFADQNQIWKRSNNQNQQKKNLFVPLKKNNHTPAMGGMGGTFSKYLMGCVGWVFLFFGTGGMGFFI